VGTRAPAPGNNEPTVASHEPDGAEGWVSGPPALHSALDGGADRLYPGIVGTVLAAVDPIVEVDDRVDVTRAQIPMYDDLVPSHQRQWR
jgi:hypothetical protein